MKKRIYLDNNATTPLDPRVYQTFIEHASSLYGNPSSVHQFGQQIRSKILTARNQIADVLGVESDEIIFTSGGTEGVNHILFSFFQNLKNGHLITSNLEHSCTYETAKELEKRGIEVEFLSPDLNGTITSEKVEQAIRPNTKMIALMAVNNETGLRTDIEKIAYLAQFNHIPFVVDAVALIGKEEFSIPGGVSAMVFSGHKMHAPQGIGFSLIRKSLRLPPLLYGGQQEYGHRGGTENYLGIMALAKAVTLLKEELPNASESMRKLRDQFEQKLLSEVKNVKVNGKGLRVSNTSNLCFEGKDGEGLMMALDQEGIAVSLGSACSSGAIEPNRVLLKMGLSPEDARASIRFSLSRMTTNEEIDRTISVIIKLLS